MIYLENMKWELFQVHMNEENLTLDHSTTETCSTLKYEKVDISVRSVPARIEYLNSQFLVFDADG